MAIDPIRRIGAVAYESESTRHAGDALARLAGLPPSPAIPYLTVSLDRRTGAGPGRTEIERGLRATVDAWRPSGAASDRLAEASARIASCLDAAVDPAAQGLFLVAGGVLSVFEAIALGSPLPTCFRVGPIPALSRLVRLAEESSPYGVLAAGRRVTVLVMVTRAAHGPGGGWLRCRFRARDDEPEVAFVRRIAEATERALQDTDIDRLVVAGDEVIRSTLDETLPAPVKDRIVGTLRFDPGASEADLIAAARSVVERAERDAEAQAVRALADAVEARGRGIEGIAGVLAALHAGQVETLVMNDDFAAAGWVDFGLATYGFGDPPTRHPTGGDPSDIIPIALEEEAIRLALQAGVRIRLVAATPDDPPGDDDRMIPAASGSRSRTRAAATLDAFGGVGAKLRFLPGDELSPIASIALGNGAHGRAAYSSFLLVQLGARG